MVVGTQYISWLTCTVPGTRSCSGVYELLVSNTLSLEVMYFTTPLLLEKTVSPSSRVPNPKLPERGVKMEPN